MLGALRTVFDLLFDLLVEDARPSTMVLVSVLTVLLAQQAQRAGAKGGIGSLALTYLLTWNDCNTCISGAS